MTVIEYEYVHIPTLIRLRWREPVPYVPRPEDVVEFEADDHVQQITLRGEE